MNAEGCDPITTVKMRRSTAERVQVVKHRHGLASADVLVNKALDAFERQIGGRGNGGVHS